MKYLQKFIFVGALLFGLVSLFGLPQAHAIEYGGLGIHPNESEVDEKNSLTQSWFIYTLELGELKEAKVDVVNTSDNPQEVKVYPVDAVTTKDGAFAPEPESREKVDVGTWVTLSESELSLEPGETKTIDFTIQVPDNAEVGDHAGAIIIQSRESQNAVAGSGLQITTRVGARMYITIPGDIVRELAFTEFIWESGNDKTIFYLTLVNNGNVRILPRGEIEITNIFGKLVAIIKIPGREVFPGDTITIPVVWEPTSLLGRFTAKTYVTYDQGQTPTREVTFWIISLQNLLASQHSLSSFGLGVVIFIFFLAGIFVALRRKLWKHKEEKEDGGK